MDKFVVAIPRGGGAAAAASQKRKLAGTGAGASGGGGGGGASKLARPAAQPQQMYLDLGQKSFGANKHCGLCGMLYVVGDVDDEKRHASFCSKAKAGPSLTSIKGLTELARFDDDGRDAVVVEVKSKHKRTQHQQDAIDALMQAVQAELGSEAGFCSSITSPGSGPDGSSSSSSRGVGGGGGGETLLMYVRDRVVLACAVIQAVPPARLVALSAAVTATDVDIALPGALPGAGAALHASPAPRPAAESTPAEPNPNSDPAPATAPGPAAGPAAGPGPGPGQPPSTPTLGIKLVWTAAAARRQGLAARLLDAARRSFEFGRLVRREHVAFSQPTAAGLGLALGYCRCEWVWGYA